MLILIEHKNVSLFDVHTVFGFVRARHLRELITCIFH